MLLREAFLGAARTICGDASLDSVENAADALDRQREPGVGTPAVRANRRARVLRALGRAAVPDDATLTQAEIDVADLVDEATGDRRMARATRRAVWAFGLLAIAVAIAAVVATVMLRNPWENYTWSASSTWGAFPQSGTLGEHWAYDLLFHTDEQKDPWVIVDFHDVRTVGRILVRNRTDCCSDRSLPLMLELAGNDRTFTPVGTRTLPFEEWEVTFPPRKARFLRLSVKSTTFLHLCEIQIR
jgi:hypothetical protein